MGYNLALIYMKKIALVLIAMMGFVFAANAQQTKANVPGDNGTVIASITSDSQTSSTITFYNNSTKTIEVCVSVYNSNSGGSKVAEDCFSIPSADAEYSHTETTETLSKGSACSTCTSGCEAKRIEITKVKVQN